MFISVNQPTLRDIVEKRKNTPKEKNVMIVWTSIGKNIMTIWTSHSELEFI